jgi:hypothetical protein
MPFRFAAPLAALAMLAGAPALAQTPSPAPIPSPVPESPSVEFTPVGVLWANPAARAVLLKDLPAIEPYVDQVKDMTLAQLAPLSQGALDDAKLQLIQADLQKAGK